MTLDAAFYFPMSGLRSGDRRIEALYTLDGQRYYLCCYEDCVLYRIEDADNVGQTRWVPYHDFTLPDGTWARRPQPDKHGLTAPCAAYPEGLFWEQVRGGQAGRFVVYASPQARDSLTALFFAPDGTGRGLSFHPRGATGTTDANSPDTHRSEFRWHGLVPGLSSPDELLECDYQALRGLCAQVFEGQIWPSMTDPYADIAEFPDVSLHFLRGSRAGLEHITSCICQSSRRMFLDVQENSAELLVAYRSDTPTQQGGYVECRRQAGGVRPLLHGEQIDTLFALAFAHNTFYGVRWNYGPSIAPTIRASYRQSPAEIAARVTPPTNSERSEALVTLWNWLEGKVSEEERRRLLPHAPALLSCASKGQIAFKDDTRHKAIMSDFWKRWDKEKHLRYLDGQPCHAVEIGDLDYENRVPHELLQYTLYRPADQNDSGAARFVPPPSSRSRYAGWTGTRLAAFEAVSAGQMWAGAGGRFVLYDCPGARGIGALFFAPDGTGVFFDYHADHRHQSRVETLNFNWRDCRHGLAAPGDVVGCGGEALQRLCAEAFAERIWPRMKDPYVSVAEFPDAPLGFTCGSRADLEYITRCICFTDKTLSDPSAPWFSGLTGHTGFTVMYDAFVPKPLRMSNQPSGFKEIRITHYPYTPSPFLKRLLDLAFAHNKFSGAVWEQPGKYDVELALRPMSLGAATPHPPSQHERTEALLTLWDWLEGKVSEQERRSLLQMDEDTN